MSTFLRAQRHLPAATPVGELPRVALAARVAVLRDLLTRLADQAALDGGEPFESVGRMKVELIRLEGEVRRIDQGSAHDGRAV